MSEEDELLLGTIAGVDLILSPEHYKKYKGTLNKQIEELKTQLQQKENIIKEVREWVNKTIFYFDFEEEITKHAFDLLYTKQGQELLEILDKEEIK